MSIGSWTNRRVSTSQQFGHGNNRWDEFKKLTPTRELFASFTKWFRVDCHAGARQPTGATQKLAASLWIWSRARLHFMICTHFNIQVLITELFPRPLIFSSCNRDISRIFLKTSSIRIKFTITPMSYKKCKGKVQRKEEKIHRKHETTKDRCRLNLPFSRNRGFW